MSIINDYKTSLAVLEKMFEDLETYSQEIKEGYMGSPEDFVEAILKKFELLCDENGINVMYDGSDIDLESGKIEEYYMINPEIAFTIDASQVDVDPRIVNRNSKSALRSRLFR